MTDQDFSIRFRNNQEKKCEAEASKIINSKSSNEEKFNKLLLLLKKVEANTIQYLKLSGWRHTDRNFEETARAQHYECSRCGGRDHKVGQCPHN